MTRKEQYETHTEELLCPIIEEFGVELYDVEYVKEGSEWYLRAYIDKEGGVTIEDCENVSRALSDVLDQEDMIKDPYILEVSSPGLGRALKKDKHLKKSIGSQVDIRLFKPLEKKKDYTGVLKAFDERSITVEADGIEITFPRTEIASIKLALDI